MKKVEIKLSKSSIRSAINELNEYKHTISKNTEKLKNTLAENCVEYAKSNVSSMDRYGTLGKIQEGIKVENSNGKSIVRATDSHSVWVEFGTGTRGANSPHEISGEIGWEYAVGSHIGYWNVDGKTMFGWWYPTTPDDPNIYTRQVIDDETNEPNGDYVAFTEGTEARPFMYNAANQIRSEITETAKKVFGND